MSTPRSTGLMLPLDAGVFVHRGDETGIHTPIWRLARIVISRRAGTDERISRLADMDTLARRALEQIEVGEAEIAVLKQEQVIRELLSTGEPTAEATALLQALRDAAAKLAALKRID